LLAGWRMRTFLILSAPGSAIMAFWPSCRSALTHVHAERGS
jgi:hypothetical protein